MDFVDDVFIVFNIAVLPITFVSVVSGKRVDYVIRLRAKELITLSASFLQFAIKDLDSSIFAAARKNSTCTKLHGSFALDPFNFCALWFHLSSLAFQIFLFFKSYLSKPTRMCKDLTQSCCNLSPSLRYRYWVFVECIFRFIVFMPSTLLSLSSKRIFDYLSPLHPFLAVFFTVFPNFLLLCWYFEFLFHCVSITWPVCALAGGCGARTAAWRS